MKKIVVNGTFDVIHPGHLALLNYAKSLGDFLLVAIDSDERVKQLKGSTRPVNDQYSRQLMLQHLKPVNEVVIFNSDDELLHYIKQCSIMVKGSDYKDKPIIGAEYCKKIDFYERLEAFSTTKKIQSIINR